MLFSNCLRSPVHPAVFACVDGLGRVSIFNLVNKDFGQPVVNKVITKGCGICRCDWSQNGKQLLFGDADGNMHLFEVAEEVNIVQWNYEASSSNKYIDVAHYC